MELTENERLMFVQKKEEILKLTQEILDIKDAPKQALETKKMTNILSLISTIASYADSNYDLIALWNATNLLFLQMNRRGSWMISSMSIEVWCNTVNSIRFNFAKRDIKIRIPKIDLTIFKSS